MPSAEIIIRSFKKPRLIGKAVFCPSPLVLKTAVFFK